MAEAFRARGGAAVRFVGTPAGLERQIVPRSGFEVSLAPPAALRGRPLTAMPRIAGNVVRSVFVMRRVLRAFRADVVFGTGGSVSGIAALAARSMGIPTVLLEPNASPGLANRWSAPLATRVAVGFAATRSHFKGRAVVTGIPVRKAFFRAPAAGAPKRRLSVLVTGGSQGASPLNGLVTGALPVLRKRAGRIRFTHQTGPADEQAVLAAYRAARSRAPGIPYLAALPSAFAGADLVVSRAGAITCAELAAAARPAMVVPAAVAGAHQRDNAAALAAAGAAEFVEETISSPAFGGRLAAILDDRPRREAMARAAAGLARPAAAEDLAKLLERPSVTGKAAA